jgi:hypothetical protein
MKANESKSLSFAFIYFSESGLSNGLQAIQIRKLSAPPPAPVMRETHSLRSSLRRRPRARSPEEKT